MADEAYEALKAVLRKHFPGAADGALGENAASLLACAAAHEILFRSGKDLLPDNRAVAAARARRRRIANLSARLASALEEETRSNLWVTAWLRSTQGDEVPMTGDEQRDFADALRQLPRRYPFDDPEFRRSVGLPPRHAANKDVFAYGLWPFLFLFWTYQGRPVAQTEGGSLHQFVVDLHGALDFDPPAFGTLRDAIQDWRARYKLAGNRWMHQASSLWVDFDAPEPQQPAGWH